MKLSDFIALEEEEKRLAIRHVGVLVAKRKDLDSLVFLFQVGSYYVEAICDREDRAVKEYRVSDNVRFLHPYLESIRIEELLR